jgi:raffinose/stachyose/melibiose transport system substrate-binding protein
MKKRRGVRHGLVALTAIVPLLAACGGGSASNSDGVALWHEFSGTGNDAINKVIDTYNSSNPNAKIEPRQIADDQVDTVLRTGMSGNNPPDVLQYEGYQHTADYAKNGQLTDLTDWWNAHKSQFAFADSQLVKDACEYQGRMYCIPWGLQTNNQFYVNPELLKKAGVEAPKTFADVLADVPKFKAAGIIPISLYSSENWEAGQWYALLAVQRCGVETLRAAIAQNGAKWTDPCFLQAANDLAALGANGVFPEGVAGSDFNSMMSLFASGKAAMMNTGTWYETTIAETPPSFPVETIPFPQLDPAKPSTQLHGGLSAVFGIPTKAKHPEAAKKFLDTLATPESGRLFAEAQQMTLAKGSDQYLSPRLKTAWQEVVSAIGPNGDQDGIIVYLENLLPTSVGKDTLLNGATGLASGQLKPQKFVDDLQNAAARAGN